MSSLPSSASPTSIDTRLPGSTTFLNASSAANDGPVISSLSSSSLISVISSDPAHDLPTSSKDVPDVASSTTHSPPTQAPSTTRSGFSVEETVGSATITVAQDGSSTRSDKPALPTTTTESNQADPSSPAQSPSSAQVSSSQIVTLTTVSTRETPKATQFNQTPSSVTAPSQSSAAGIETAQEISPAPAKPTLATRSQATAVAAHPTDDATQEPQVFSAESVNSPAETSTLPSSSAASSPVAAPSIIPAASPALKGAKADSSSREQPPVAPTGAVNQAVSASVASSASITSISSTSLSSVPTPTSISTPAPDSAAIFVAPSAAASTPVSVSSVPLSDSISSGISYNTAIDATSTTTGAGGIAFPTAIGTSPGDVSESSPSAGSQPTGQPIEDPVGSRSKPATGIIVGGTIGGVAAVAVFLILLWLWKRRAADGRQGSSKVGGFTEKDSSKSMAQRLGISTTLNAVRRNLGEKLGSHNVDMDRGNSQFLEATVAEPSNATLPPDPLCQHPVTPENRPREFRKGQGMSLEPGKFNPFSDAHSLMSGTARPPSSSSVLNPFSDDNMVLPPPVSASTRRSRGRSLGGLGNFQVPRGSPRPHSVHRESVHGLETMNENRESFLQRRDKCRSDPFDLELQSNQLFPPGTALSTRASSVYSGQFQQNSHDSYTSRYVSGSSLGDWGGGVKQESVAYEGLVERVDSPTIA